MGGHTTIWSRDWKCGNCRKPMARNKCLLLLQLEPCDFKHKGLLLWKIDTYFNWTCVEYCRPIFFWLPLTQHLMLSKKTQNSYFILLVEQDSFFIPLYVGAWMPFFIVLTLTLHKVPMLACIAQHILVEMGEI